MTSKKPRILYAVQGTGNGHLARSLEIVPLLNELGDTDVLVSGIQGDIQLPFPVRYQFYGLSFIFGKRGGVDLRATIRKSRLMRMLRDIISLPVQDYDIVFCDFEPISAWACRLKGKKCYGLSHQNAVLHKKAPRPRRHDQLGHWILKNYAPASSKFGFHFKSLDDRNFTPVIRPSIRQAKPTKQDHYTVYLPAYSNEEIEQVLGQFPNQQWQVFSKHNTRDYRSGSIWFRPVSLRDFTQSFVNCTGMLCSAGFETPAEAIFMNKKLCVIPMKGQYEQACNAAFLGNMGIRVLSSWHKSVPQLKEWLDYDSPMQIRYPDQTAQILERVIAEAQAESFIELNQQATAGEAAI